jgi:hypothetical protein
VVVEGEGIVWQIFGVWSNWCEGLYRWGYVLQVRGDIYYLFINTVRIHGLHAERFLPWGWPLDSSAVAFAYSA